MTRHRDLLDRSQPNDQDKSPSLEQQARQGERPATPKGAGGASYDADTAPKPAGGRVSDRDRTPFRPRDEGGATPTRR